MSSPFLVVLLATEGNFKCTFFGFIWPVLSETPVLYVVIPQGKWSIGTPAVTRELAYNHLYTWVETLRHCESKVPCLSLSLSLSLSPPPPPEKKRKEKKTLNSNPGQAITLTPQMQYKSSMCLPSGQYTFHTTKLCITSLATMRTSVVNCFTSTVHQR